MSFQPLIIYSHVYLCLHVYDQGKHANVIELPILKLVKVIWVATNSFFIG